MKQDFFVKCHFQLNKITGSQGATTIMSILEFKFVLKPDGFWKFLQPCAHRLYKKGDSLCEELCISRKKLNKDFDRIGVTYKSRTEYEAAQDKFQGKMYARYYDRNTNLTHYFRNHDLVNKILIEYGLKNNVSLKPTSDLENRIISSDDGPIRNGRLVTSYIETKNPSNDLSKDKSHAGEIIKKMIEIWTTLVGPGKDQFESASKRAAYLRKAFVDKFDNCLEKWKKFCQDIASSLFLMGEKKQNGWKATLDWALKFESIQKIFDGHYGIGDRIPKETLPSQVDLQEEIFSSVETQQIKDFRALCLKTVGNAKYISYFKNLAIEFREDGAIILTAPHKFGADDLERNCSSYLRLILAELGKSITTITILAPGESRGRLIEKKREGYVQATIPTTSGDKHPLSKQSFEEDVVTGDDDMPGVSLETQALRDKLRINIPAKLFPGWLSGIEVEKINQDGEIVVSLENSFAVGWCKSRFSGEILQAAASIWKGVNSLIIRQKIGETIQNSIQNSVENSPKKSEDVDKSSALEQAIRSLLSVCSINSTGTFRHQEAAWQTHG